MKRLLLAIFAFLAITAGGFWAVSQRTGEALASDCDDNAIIRCGVTSQKDLQDKYKSDTSKDLPEVFSHYKISGSQISGQKAVWGYVHKNGDVKVNGTVVATGAKTVGRQNMPGSTAIRISVDGKSKTFYERTPSVSFRQDAIKALVFLDANGKFQNAILTSCGNPVVATPKPKPLYQCLSLAVKKVTRTDFTFQAAVKTQDVTFKHITYTVKKNGTTVGKPIVVTNQNPVKYTQPTAGSYTVEATVTVVSNGKQVTSPVGGCKANMSVDSAPSYACTGLTVTANSGDRTKFTFKPTVTVANGAAFKSVVYTVKNASGETVFTSPAQNTTNAYSYSQTREGKYTVSAATTFTAEGKTVTTNDAKCKGEFEVKGAPVTPSYVCKSLTVTQRGDRTQFVFTPSVELKNATLKNIVYTVKNAQGQTVGEPIVRTNLNPYEYTQTTVGKYSVSAVVNVTVDGKDAVATGNCADEFEVKPEPVAPNYKCTDLKASVVAGQKNTYQYSVFYVAEGGAKLSKVSVNYGDGKSEDIALNKLNGFNHTYDKAGEYTTKATLSFVINDDTANVKTVDCAVNVKITEFCPVPGKETLPVGDKNCYEPCPRDNSIPKTDAACAPCPTDSTVAANDTEKCKEPETPTVLVSTGPGDIIGMFAAISIAGAIAHRFVWARRFNS